MLVQMGRKPLVPAELTRKPFTIEEARRAGLRRWHLEGASWRRVGSSTYIWAGLPETPIETLAGALRRLPAGTAFSGLTAAWLHGIGVSPCDPIEVTVRTGVGVSARAGIAVRRSPLGGDDVVDVRGMPTTSVVRTLAEVCCRLRITEAVVMADAALHLGRVSIHQLTSWARAHAGCPGITTFRRVIELAEPAAESPMESRLRMVLVLGGLPRPKAQASIHDRTGRFVGRPDLYYESQRLGIEYDGGTHRNSLAEDNRRQNRLLDAGVHLLRFTAGDVLNSPDSVVLQVRAMLVRHASHMRVPRAKGATG